MELDELRDYCLAKKGVSEDMPFGEGVIVFRVGGKIFVLAPVAEIPPTANLKCDPGKAIELRERYEQIKPGYHMNKKHWNTVELDNGLSERLLYELIDHSYEQVLKTLKKSEREELAATEEN
jgi:predicted DNA-binding protein (MmcQ/YjbR family)